MANEQRGEVSFEASGKTWTMKFGTTAMCEIESATGKNITEIGKVLSDPNTATITLMRAVFWGSLQHKHEGISLKACGDLMDDIGVSRTGELIGEAFQAAFPSKKADDENPRKATAA